ncbi:MAG: hypothetical protein IKT58_00690 [Oscillospiraceae bacterium]|nr:hypothetical protein [Oscillospiraceae bacterium]
MDRYDPNQWTPEFVAGNKDFCIRQIKETNELVIRYLKEGEHKPVIAGMDRILNGLVTMMNIGYDYRSHACFFSWIEANVLLFGNLQDAPEKNRIATAKKMLLDASDFAKSENAKNSIREILNDIDRGYDLSALERKYAEDFPNFEIETLWDLNSKLDDCSGTPVNAGTSENSGSQRKKRRPRLLIFVLILLGIFAIKMLTTSANDTKPAPVKNTKQTEETLSQSTGNESESEEEAEPEATVDPVEELQRNLIGTWDWEEIREGIPSPYGDAQAAYMTTVTYYFYEDGRYALLDGTYEEVSKDSANYDECIHDRYWVCVGGGGQSGSYSLSETELTLVTDDSVQYGSSVTSVLPFRLAGDELTIEHYHVTRVYQRNHES